MNDHNNKAANAAASLQAQAHATLEAHLGHNPQLLAAAKAQLDQRDPASLQQSMDNTPAGKIAKGRNNITLQRQYQVLTDALDGPLETLLKSLQHNATTTRTLRAVDLASGSAYFPSQWALRYRPSCFPGNNAKAAAAIPTRLEWIPTDTAEAIQQFTRPCLRHLVAEQTYKTKEENTVSSPLFVCHDGHGKAVYANNHVVLQGLKSTAYNGKQGRLRGKDPHVPGRYAVQLLLEDHDEMQQEKVVSFRAQNIFLTSNNHNNSTTSGNDHANDKDDNQAHAILQGLLDRTCALDLLSSHLCETHETWQGTCALVTCTNLLTEIGPVAPTVWKTVMALASRWLVSGGYLLQGDADGWDGGFGNRIVMEKYATSLGMTLQQHVQLQAWVLVLWKKN